MRKRIRLTPENTSLFGTVWNIFEENFPPEERRLSLEQHRLLYNPKYYLDALLDTSKVVGLLSYWVFNELIFIEHLAIASSEKGQGLGTLFLKDFLFQRNKNILLEVEIPHTEIQQKRINFYQKIGFHLNTYPYTQPPYQPGFPPIPMHVMTYPKAFNKSQINHFVEQYHPLIYKKI